MVCCFSASDVRFRTRLTDSGFGRFAAAAICRPLSVELPDFCPLALPDTDACGVPHCSSLLKTLTTMASPPDWLREFADAIAEQIRAVDLLAPIGCHLFHAVDVWEVTLFVSSTEVIGGQHDGRERASRFFLDLQGVASVFDTVESFAWQAQDLGDDDDVGPHISVEGSYQGEAIWLRIPATAPPAFQPGRQANAYHHRWEETW